MARNGRERQTREDLRREAADRLAAVKRTAAALEDRLRERSDQVGDAIDRTRDQIQSLDQFVHRYRYVFIGGALGLGVVVGRRRRTRRPELTATGGNGVRYVLVERTQQRGVVRSLLGGVAALALRQGASWLVDQLDRPQEDEEVPLLLPPRRQAKVE
jgi:ElaB/YqjD/DUF883 family membrane-anchored ribosome-binding protein